MKSSPLCISHIVGNGQSKNQGGDLQAKIAQWTGLEQGGTQDAFQKKQKAELFQEIKTAIHSMTPVQRREFMQKKGGELPPQVIRLLQPLHPPTPQKHTRLGRMLGFLALFAIGLRATMEGVQAYPLIRTNGKHPCDGLNLKIDGEPFDPENPAHDTIWIRGACGDIVDLSNEGNYTPGEYNFAIRGDKPGTENINCLSAGKFDPQTQTTTLYSSETDPVMDHFRLSTIKHERDHEVIFETNNKILGKKTSKLCFLDKMQCEYLSQKFYEKLFHLDGRHSKRPPKLNEFAVRMAGRKFALTLRPSALRQQQQRWGEGVLMVGPQRGDLLAITVTIPNDSRRAPIVLLDCLRILTRNELSIYMDRFHRKEIDGGTLAAEIRAKLWGNLGNDTLELADILVPGTTEWLNPYGFHAQEDVQEDL